MSLHGTVSIGKWEPFFIASNIPADTASTYGTTFVQNHITEDILPDLTKHTLDTKTLSHYQANQTTIIHYSTTPSHITNPGSSRFTKFCQSSSCTTTSYFS